MVSKVLDKAFFNLLTLTKACSFTQRQSAVHEGTLRGSAQLPCELLCKDEMNQDS